MELTEDDNIMKWFLEQANGGDVLILRTSGSDGYIINIFIVNYGICVNSVESLIVFNNAFNIQSKLYTQSKILEDDRLEFKSFR